MNVQMMQDMQQELAGAVQQIVDNMARHKPELATPREQKTVETLNIMAQAFQSIEVILNQQLQMAAQSLQMSSQALELASQTLTTLERPKSISIGNIQKDASGNVIGVTTNTRLQ